MSVTFYCSVWAFASDLQKLNQITREELLDLAIEPNEPDEYEKEPWLLEARKKRAGEIQQKHDYMMKIYASGSYGHCLNIKKLAFLHKDILFISISGADCTDEETVSLFKNGEKVHSCDAVLRGDKLLAELRVHHYYLVGEDLCARMEMAYNEMIERIVGESAQDIILQDDPEEQ